MNTLFLIKDHQIACVNYIWLNRYMPTINYLIDFFVYWASFSTFESCCYV